MPLETSPSKWQTHWLRQRFLAKKLWLYAAIITPMGFLINVATTTTATTEVIGAHAITMFLLAPLLISAAHLIVETPLVCYNRMPQPSSTADIGLRILCQALGLLATMFLTVVILENLFSLKHLLAPPLMSATALVLCMLAISTLYEAFKDREIAILRFRSLQAEARYQNLNDQIQPHFLFNSLNVLAEVVHLDPQKGIQGILALSRIYQSIVDLSPRRTIPLSEELELIRAYLGIQELRFGDRAKASFTIIKDLEHIPVPPFTVFSLVENAMKHGIAHIMQHGVIHIAVERDHDFCLIRVINAAPDCETNPAKRQGIGLENTDSRLKLVYGDAATLNLVVKDRLATATIRVPMDRIAKLSAL